MLKTQWPRHFVLVKVSLDGAVEEQGDDETTFNVNSQRLKHYCGDKERRLENLVFKE